MRRGLALVLFALLLVTVAAWADENVAKKPESLQDQVSVVVHPGAEKNQAVAVLSASNVNTIRVMSFPLKYVAGEEPIHFDSISYAGTRVEHFKTRAHTNFPKRSAVLMILMAPSVGKAKYADLKPGAGEIARIYFSSEGQFPLEKFKISPVTLPPDNKLMYVTDAFASVEPTFEYLLAGEKAGAKGLVKDQ